jgi:hypothetical protein
LKKELWHGWHCRKQLWRNITRYHALHPTMCPHSSLTASTLAHYELTCPNRACSDSCFANWMRMKWSLERPFKPVYRRPRCSVQNSQMPFRQGYGAQPEHAGFASFGSHHRHISTVVSTWRKSSGGRAISNIFGTDSEELQCRSLLRILWHLPSNTIPRKPGSR